MIEGWHLCELVIAPWEAGGHLHVQGTSTHKKQSQTQRLIAQMVKTKRICPVQGDGEILWPHRQVIAMSQKLKKQVGNKGVKENALHICTPITYIGVNIVLFRFMRDHSPK